MSKALLIAAVLLSPSCNRSTIVNIQSVNPHILLDIRYATTNNFTKQKVYDSANCFLRTSTARKLSDTQHELEKLGLGLKVYDCYRPLAVQRKFWAILPDDRYVANPAKGSRHNRGAAVDLTLVNSSGQEVEMPTQYDDFTEKAHRDYSQLPPEALKNRAILEHVMTRHGFVGLPPNGGTLMMRTGNPTRSFPKYYSAMNAAVGPGGFLRYGVEMYLLDSRTASDRGASSIACL